jgi:hypothetical protein
MTKFKAIQEFRVNFSGDSVTVRPGTVFDYDGLNIEVVGSDGVTKKGTAPSLQKVIGEWLVQVDTNAPVTKATAPIQGPREAQVRVPDQSKSAPSMNIGGAGIIASGNLADLVDKYDKASLLKDKAGPTIINDDATIVKTVKKVAGENTATNASGVHIEDSEVGKRTTVYREQQAVKATHYNPTLDASEPPKQRREILSDSDGVIVKKTKVPSIFKTEMNENVRVRETDTGDTIIEGAVAKETTYEEHKPIDVTGSSTQAQVIPKANSNPKRAADEKAKRMKQIGLDQQEGVVVAKVRKDEVDKTTAEGFVAKLTVGKAEEDITGLEAKVSSGGTDIEGLEAKISSGGNPSISDGSSDEAQIIESDEVDIKDILEGI